MASRFLPLVRLIAATILLLLTALPAAASAADVSANLAIVSDYRFRGISASNRRPAVQGGADIGLSSGWFAGTWGSSIARYGGAHAEIDLYGGRSGTAAGFSYSVTAAGYLYPGGSHVDYGEVQAEFGRTIGPATLTIESAYVPHQRNTATANMYVGARAEFALADAPLRLKLRGGYEDGFYADKLDWEAGLSYGTDRLSASLSIVGTDHAAPSEAGKQGRTGLIFALTTVL